MFLQRSAIAAARRAAVSPVVKRSFATSFVRPRMRNNGDVDCYTDIKTEDDLIGLGAATGSVPTDVDQATGLERLEILGKMQGIDIFDMKPLDASRKGTLDNPIIIKSAGDEQYAGCTGYPADSHVTIWLTTSRERPIERCPECGSVYKMEYVGPQEDPHAHDHGHGHGHDHHAAYEEPKTFADFVKPEYR
ncbi:cytochrome c oxidase subunit VB [Bisporella sp. PMI_857]|nr:cytochrome c oxidase subunit VB [Bisporella sp. PMI_857]KAH8600386.1 cytochrome c oxidase subunit VB [Bisporella sp. PMI_857]